MSIMDKLAKEVLAGFGWNIVDAPETKVAFNAIRDALAVSPLHFANHSIEHSPDGPLLWVNYTFESRKYGHIDLRWHLSPEMVDKVHEGHANWLATGQR